jgi:hypothetical protein
MDAHPSVGLRWAHSPTLLLCTRHASTEQTRQLVEEHQVQLRVLLSPSFLVAILFFFFSCAVKDGFDAPA